MKRIYYKINIWHITKIKTLLAVKSPDTLINGELSSRCVSREFFSRSGYIDIQYFYRQSWKYPIPKYIHMVNHKWEEN